MASNNLEAVASNNLEAMTSNNLEAMTSNNLEAVTKKVFNLTLLHTYLVSRFCEDPSHWYPSNNGTELLAI